MPIKEASTKFKKTALDFFSVVLLFTSMFRQALAQLKPRDGFIGIKEASAKKRRIKIQT